MAWLCITLWPVSNKATRIGSLAAFGVALVLLLVASWPRVWCRLSCLAVGLAFAVFLLWPATPLNPKLLRRDFVASLRRYEGIRYHWGGENFTGIDCSGLVRRGWVDAWVIRGLCDLNPSLIRQALRLWWHDFSASDLGEGRNGLTVPVAVSASINDLEYKTVVPGDLAVTTIGEHVMAYLGGRLWIEADPVAGRVITVKAPCQTNAWFNQKIEIVRLRDLAE